MSLDPELTEAPKEFSCKVCSDRRKIRMAGSGEKGVVIPCPRCMKDAGVDAIAELVVETLTNTPEESLVEMLTVGNRGRQKFPHADPLPPDFRLKEKYDIKCPYCEVGFCMSPGLAMRMGLNSGHGQCLGCKKHFHILIDVRDNTAKGIHWDVPGV